MKINFKKVATVLGSALMLGSTAAFAAAASFTPSSFTDNGVALVVGQKAASSDLKAAIDLTANLAPATAAATTATVTGGDAATLASGTNMIYLGDALNAQVETITDDALSSVLASGTFEDDNSQSYDYDQTITVGARTFTFSDSSGDLTDPALIVNVGDSASSPLYTSVVTFTEAVNFTDADSKGQDITLFGKTYTIGSSTDSTSIQLLGAGQELRLDSASATSTVTVGEDSYEVVVNGVSDDGTEVSVSVNGESKSIDEGSTKRIGGLSVYAKDLLHLVGDTWTATIQVGADEIYLESGSPVQIGTDKDDIEGTLVTLTGGTTATTKIQVAVAAADNDADHVAIGGEFDDPVFGSFKLTFPSAPNAPTLGAKGADSNAARNTIEFSRASDDAVQVELAVKGDSATVEFADGADLEDDDNNDIEVVEGAVLSEDEYYILNSGNYQRMVQVTKVTTDDDNTADDDVTLKDVFTGEEIKLEDKDLDASTAIDWSIDGQTYKVKSQAAGTANNTVIITSSDYAAATTRYAFPYLETISGKDTRVAFVDQVTLTGVDATTDVELPTGTLDTADLVNGTAASIAVGSVRYYALLDNSTGTLSLSVNKYDNATASALANPTLMLVEEEDNSDSDALNAVIVPTTYSTYAEVDLSGILFTGTAVENVGFDDNDFAGSIDAFGTLVVEDSSDADQDFAVITYPKEQMYAELYVAEKAATISADGTTSSVGVVTVYDNEVSSASGKNLIVIGGSCVNTVAAELLGGALCGDAFTAKTGIKSGEALIESFARSGKIALLVAGYDAADTTKAVTYLSNNNVNTAAGSKLKVTSATTATAITA